MDIGAFGKGKGKQGKQGQQGQHGQYKDKSADTTRKAVGAWGTPTMVVRMENTNPRMQMLTILTRNHLLLNQKSKSMNSTRVVSTLTHFNNKSLRGCEGSEWIKIGVDTGAGKTSWPQSITYWKKLPGHDDLALRTATGELVKSGERTLAYKENNVYHIYMKPRAENPDPEVPKPSS